MLIEYYCFQFLFNLPIFTELPGKVGERLGFSWKLN